jgi:hypothetical protein
MILQFDTQQEADERNKFEAFKRGCQTPTVFWWKRAELNENSGKWELDVGDGDGLTDEELAMAIDED